MGEFVQFVSAFGFDVAIILFIVLMTYVLRALLKIPDKLVPLIPMGLGFVMGILQIIFSKIESNSWLRIILGYPSVSLVSYMLYRKYFPNMRLLKHKDLD